MALSRLLTPFRVYACPQAKRLFFLGFSSGLPLLLVLGTLSFWLRENGVSLQTIGFMSWAGLCWGFKWAWAPLVDRLRLPLLTNLLGRRRSWLLLSQLALMGCLSSLAFCNPKENITVIAILAVATAFFSATQDIALDAYRIESAPSNEQAALAATYQMGYRLAMIWSGAGCLAIASAAQDWAFSAWGVAYLCMAASVLVGVVAVLLSPEPIHDRELPPAKSFQDWIYSAVCLPFIEFFSRLGWQAAWILALVAVYRISDILIGVIANPFYFDMGFSKAEVAAVSKVFGVIMTLLGAVLGGAVATRIGVMKTLFWGAFLAALTNLLFCALAYQGHNLSFLVLTISADNLAGGLASSAFIAYLSSLTASAFSATQYALLSSIMLLLPKFLAGFSGWFVERFGYSDFFLTTAALGLPVLLLIWIVAQRGKQTG